MKILVISHMYPSTVNTTYGIFVHEQVKALAAEGCEVRVISPVPYAPWPLPLLRKKWQDYSSIPSRDVWEGVQIYYPRYIEFPGSYLLHRSGYFMYLGIRGIVKNISKEFPFDLIHAHVALPDGHAAYYLQKEYQVPTVVSIHGQDFQSTLPKGDKFREKLRKVLGGVDGVIAVSNKLKNLVQDEPYYSKIQVINNGIALAGQALPGDADNKCVILSVSNLKKTKGIDLNLQALATLVKKYPHLQYVIVGDGEERKNLEKLVEDLDLKNHVTFKGKLPHAEVLEEMAKCQIFCLPSWQEGFGVVYIEAMAQGVPVIGVKGEGIEDAIQHGVNGLLVNPKNVEEIVQAIESLLTSPDYGKKIAQKGKETVYKEFTWENNARKTIELYRDLI